MTVWTSLCLRHAAMSVTAWCIQTKHSSRPFTRLLNLALSHPANLSARPFGDLSMLDPLTCPAIAVYFEARIGRHLFYRET